MQRNLIPLTLGGLGLGITEFVMMGLLPDIANNLHITIPEAGHLISAYAFGVVIGAPLLVLIANQIPPKKLLFILMLLFTIFNGISTFAPNYQMLLICRFLSGLPHGAFFGVGSIVASQIAKQGRESQAIAVMFAGLTIANIVGVPLGTFIGHNFSWRYTFAFIAIVGLITMYSISTLLPVIVNKHEKRTFAEELKFFKNIDSCLIVLIIAIGTGGLFCWFSYIAPLLINVGHFSPQSISYILTIAGLGMFIGNFVGGKLADSYSPLKATAIILFAMTLALIIIYYTSSYKPMALIMTFITGGIAFSTASPIQTYMINSTNGSAMFSGAISQASFNISNALGAFLGGLPLTLGYGFRSPELVGTAMAFSGLVLVCILLIRTKNDL